MSTLYLQALEWVCGGPLELTLRGGECVTLSGASGSGKTTLLRAIADLDPPEGGEVRLGDMARHEIEGPAWRRRVAFLPAESRWWADTVGAHLPRPPLENRFDRHALAELGFDDAILESPVPPLSTGERQRLALFRVLRNRPQALLLDEPTAGLDPVSTGKVERLVREYARGTGAPVLWVTHTAEQAERLGARRYQLRAGKLHTEGGKG
ncbi:ABC transporter ATP-binding protein [Kiritimatiella glycovorans]|uniref:Putative ABC transporter ATP-binding protein YbbL n=1 Tax=Kiritimatiella glycovorans TaxID=1307763 RepID=A0A0G3EKC8_9BACT|nr:ATP-binding cassette domain-containing protein [Kiritimatiella glycovorans]AKJ65275.1 putative ABC transporter ATP-binding protein YbbL [Kiritimatiella glycovorans]